MGMPYDGVDWEHAGDLLRRIVHAACLTGPVDVTEDDGWVVMDACLCVTEADAELINRLRLEVDA